MLEIITTGSRSWKNVIVIQAAITWAMLVYGEQHDTKRAWLAQKAKLKTGGCPTGSDAIVARCAKTVGHELEWFLPDEFDMGERFRIRNQRMVDSGGKVCLVFANDWASGSGMTARMARKAGIPTFDFGCETGRQQ